MMQSETTNELCVALAKAQGLIELATFNKENPFFKNKYADLGAVITAIRKPLSDNGLSITQTTELRENGFVLVTTLRHSTGQWVASEYPLPVGGKPQDIGSALTYARRYSLSAIICIASEEDDDAERTRKEGIVSTTPKPKISIKPQAQTAPVNPKTGDTSPHTITTNDMRAWGGIFASAINMSRDPDELSEWIATNAKNLDALEGVAPKTRARIEELINKKQEEFNKSGKQEAA